MRLRAKYRPLCCAIYLLSNANQRLGGCRIVLALHSMYIGFRQATYSSSTRLIG